jgi:predicted  nucleic acid-binding Zn-ribbon protein
MARKVNKKALQKQIKELKNNLVKMQTLITELESRLDGELYCECHLVEINWCPETLEKEWQNTIKHIQTNKTKKGV